MSKQFIPTDAVATVPVTFTDQVGRPVAAPTDLTPSFDSSVATVTYASGTLTITPVALGEMSIGLPGVPETLDVTVGDPSISDVSFGAATFAPKA